MSVETSVANDPIVLNPNDEFDKILIEMKTIHDKKKSDYAAKNDRFSNFTQTAAFAGITPRQVFETLIGVKQARLLNLYSQNITAPKNESIRDTLLDRAVYAVLALAFYDKENG